MKVAEPFPTNPPDATSDAPHARSAGLELRILIGTLLRHSLIVLLTASVIMLAIVGILSQMDTSYTATALIVVDESEARLVGLDDANTQPSNLNNRIETEAEVLGSSAVLLSAAQRLQLWRDDEFGITPGTLQKLRSLITFTPVAAPILNEVTDISQLTPAMRAQLVTNLGDALRIRRRGLTSVLAVSAVSKSPEKAAEIANSVSDAFIDLQVEARVQSAQRAARFLQERVEGLAVDLSSFDAEIDEFILEQSGKIGTPQARDAITALRQQIQTIEQGKQDITNLIAGLESARQGVFPAVELPADVRNLLERRAAMQARADLDLSATDIAEQIRVIEEKLDGITTSRIEDLSQKRTQTDTRTASLRKSLQDLFAQQSIPNEVAVDLYRLQRKSENSRALYESYTTRLGAVQQQIGLALPSARVVAPAITPADASYPPRFAILVLGAVAAFGFGVAAALLRDHLFGGFLSDEQFESVTGMRVGAVVPRESESPEELVVTEPLSIFAEAIRRVRVNVEMIAPKRADGQVLMVTSTDAGEGKSTISLSLARSWAVNGRRTILIDADFRQPGLTRMLGLAGGRSLNRLLLSSLTHADIAASTRRDIGSGVEVMLSETGGNWGSDVLVGSQQFADLIRHCRQNYDFVIIDTPPVGRVVDARIITRLADTAVFVVRSGHANQRGVMAAMRELVMGSHGIKLLPVLNAAHGLLGMGYGYGYGYGSGQPSENKTDAAPRKES
jgi:polysaccharide biosynthesis transport protein